MNFQSVCRTKFRHRLDPELLFLTRLNRLVILVTDLNQICRRLLGKPVPFAQFAKTFRYAWHQIHPSIVGFFPLTKHPALMG